MNSFVPLIRNEWRLLLFGFVLMFFSSAGQTYFIALFGGEIRQELSLSHSEFGAIYSFATLASAVALLWTGSFIDRIALPKVSIGVILLLALSCVLMSFSQNSAMLFLAIFLLRQLGQGLTSMTASTAMMRYLAASKGKANSLSNMGYSAAEAVIPTIIILLLVSFNWRQVWLIVAALIVVVVPVLILSLLNNHSSRHELYCNEIEDRSTLDNNTKLTTPKVRQWTRPEVIRDPLFYLFVPGLVSQSLLYTGFMFHQIHLVEEKGWSLLVWGSLYFLFSITTIVASLTVGAWVDKVGAVRLAPFVTLPMAIGLLLLSGSDSTLVAGVFMFMMGLSTGSQAAVSAPFYAERYGRLHFASIKSLGTFVMVLMTAISPVILGLFIDRGFSMNILALGGSIYACLAISIAYIGYRLSLQRNL